MLRIADHWHDSDLGLQRQGNEDNFFAEAAATMKRGATLLFAEPSGHVDAAHFAEEVEAARLAGLHEVRRVTVPRSTAALLRKND